MREKIKILGKKFSRNLLFIALGLTMFGLLVWFVIYNFVFLGKNFNNAFNIETRPVSEIKFDIEGFEKLNLIRKR